MNRERALKTFIDKVKDNYDYVLIDCTPYLGMLTINSLAAADEVIIPVQAHYLPAKGLEQLITTVGKVKRQINPDLKIGGILLTTASDGYTDENGKVNVDNINVIVNDEIGVIPNEHHKPKKPPEPER